MHNLFSYGTLQLERVQLETYGRKLKGEKDVLRYYKLEQLKITDPDVLAKSEQQFHPIVRKTNRAEDTVVGVRFELTQQELEASDSYEVADYTRVLEVFESGEKAWVYVGVKDAKE